MSYGYLEDIPPVLFDPKGYNDVNNHIKIYQPSNNPMNFTWNPMVKNWFANLYETNRYKKDDWVQFPNSASVVISKPIIKKNVDEVHQIAINFRFNAPKATFYCGDKKRGPYQDWVCIKIKSVENPQLSVYNFSPNSRNQLMHLSHRVKEGLRINGNIPVSNQARLGVELEAYNLRDFETIPHENGKKNSVSWDIKLKNAYHPKQSYVSQYDVHDPKSSLLQRTFGLFYYWDYFYKVPPLAETTLPINLKYNFQIVSPVSEGTEFRFDVKLTQRLVIQEIWRLIQNHYFINFKKFKCTLVLKYHNNQFIFDRFENIKIKPTIARYYIHASKGNFTYKKDACVSCDDDKSDPRYIIEKSKATELQKRFRKSMRFLYHGN